LSTDRATSTTNVDKSLMLLKEYLTILQQDGIQDAYFEDATKAMKFLKKTGMPLPLKNNSTLDLLKKSSGVDIQASLCINFKDTLPVTWMLWNGYPYHKKPGTRI